MHNWLELLTAAGLLAGVMTRAAFADVQSRPAGEDLARLTSGNTAFALELYARLSEGEGNLFLSPFSVSTALAMTWAGARGETAEEMARTLHFDLPSERLHPVFAQLLRDVRPAKEDGCRLHLANALWLQQGYRFLPEFLAIGRESYDAGLETLDFLHALEPSRRRINRWVAEKTEDRIRELIERGVLDATTRLVLTNAIYFKGQWAARFDPKATHEAPFILADERRVNVPLMHQVNRFRYLERPGYQVLELPYAGDALRMVVLLPKQPDGLPQLEKSLTVGAWRSCLEQLVEQEVNVALPRFTLRSSFRLDSALRSLGMQAAFVPGRADFSGMDGTRDLYIGAVLHQAYAEVNEEGTEAAGATAVVMKIRAAPKPPPMFRADHPFLFLIRDARTDSVLFIGRFCEPVPSR